MYEECNVNTYPIDCFDIAQKLYYKLVPYSTLDPIRYAEAIRTDIDGFSRVIFNPDTDMYQYIIHYNDSANQGRMRWTIFHEIGHIYLGHHDNSFLQKTEIEEAEADFFAKYAIAPPPLINETNCKNATDIYNKFSTSKQASTYIYDYYKKWLNFGPADYEPFELDLLSLFDVSSFAINFI